MKAAAKLSGQGGEFTLDDFLEQMQQVRKLGSMSKIMGMLPGMGQFREQLENFDEREIDRIQAIIQSMTPAERDNPKMIDGSRRARIARGSGRQVSDVNSLVDRFFEARKMMMSMAARRRHARHAGDARACPGWVASAARPRRSPRRARAPSAPATRPRPRRRPRRPRPRRRRPPRPTRSARRRRGDRLREGGRRARPAQGLLQVPQVGRLTRWAPCSSSTPPTSSAPGPTAGGRTARVRPAACTRRCWSRTRRTTWWCWCSRAAPRAGVRPARDAHVRTVHAPRQRGRHDRGRGPRRGRARRPGHGGHRRPVPAGPRSRRSARWPSARPGCSTSS